MFIKSFGEKFILVLSYGLRKLCYDDVLQQLFSHCFQYVNDWILSTYSGERRLKKTGTGKR